MVFIRSVQVHGPPAVHAPPELPQESAAARRSQQVVGFQLPVQRLIANMQPLGRLRFVLVGFR